MFFLRFWIFSVCLTAAFAPLYAAPDSRTVLIMGDSLSAGYGLNKEKSWPALLSQKLAKRKPSAVIINESISGETAIAFARKTDEQLKRHKPDIVIIELGCNDGLQGMPIARVKKSLSTMIERSKKSGAEVLLVGMQLPPNYGAKYSEAFYNMYGDLAKTHKVAFIPFFFKDIMDKPGMFQSDRLHPSEKAQPVLVNTVEKALTPLLDKAVKN